MGVTAGFEVTPPDSKKEEGTYFYCIISNGAFKT